MTADFRQPYSGTEYANLDWSEVSERPVDRVAAAGKTSHIDLWKAAYGLSPEGLVALTKGLRKACKDRWRNEQHCDKIVDQSIHEYLFSQCRRCQGLGEVIHNRLEPGQRFLTDKMVVCPACNGGKSHRYSDMDRSQMMELPFGKVRTKSFRSKIEWCLNWLAHADRRTNVEMNVELR